MKKRILVITCRYVVNPSPNAICMKNIIEQLKKQANVDIVCYDTGEPSEHENNIYLIKKGLLDKIQYKCEGGFYKHAKFNLKIINTLIKAKNFFRIPWWPWTDPIYTKKLYYKVKELCKQNNYDQIIAVHMPLSSLIVANKIKKEFPNIKYVAYFLDSLSGGKSLSIMSLKWNINKKLKWERKLLNNADKIIFMESSRTHNEKYNKNEEFYKNVVYLDIPLLVEDNNKKSKNYFNNDKVNITFCGTANYPLRNVKYLLSVIKKIPDDNILFHFFGNSNYEKLVNCKLKNVKYHSHVNHNQIAEILKSSDILLNMGTKTIATISGKIFEYMSYGKPIISTFSIDEESCIPYLKKYGASHLINENNLNIEEEAKKLCKFIEKNKSLKVDVGGVKKKFYYNTPDAFINEIFR